MDGTHTHHGLDYVELRTDDLEASKRFYAAAFGWTYRDYGPEYAAVLAPDGDGEVGGLYAGEGPGSTGGPLVLLWSADLDATLAAVRDAGGRAAEPYAFPGGRRFHFTDPGGNELGVWGA